jgi:hypothetical protein
MLTAHRQFHKLKQPSFPTGQLTKERQTVKGLANIYSMSLLMIMSWFLLSGICMTIIGGLWLTIGGCLFIIMGCLMMQGFKQPDQTKAKKKWIITYLGEPTKETVESFTLLLDWFPMPTIGYIEVNMNLVTHDYKAEKMLRCRGGYLIAEIVASFEPDPDCDGLGLYKYVSSGGEKNVIEQLNGILTVWMQWFANLKSLKIDDKVICKRITCDWMESSANVITDYVLKRIAGEVGRDEENGENTSLDDVRGLGIKITKLSIVLTAPEDVIKARNEANVQKGRQQARNANSISMNTLIRKRASLYGRELEPNNTDEAQILMESLTVDDSGNVKAIINQGGLNLSETKT